CAACVAGTYKVATGSADCTLCGADKYSSTVGAIQESTCSSCPANTVSEAGNNALSSCACTNGWYGQGGENTCSACPAGQYKDLRGGSTCIPCASGKYSTVVGAKTAGTCQGCPINTVSAEGSDELTDCTCTIGWTGTDGTESCSMCLAGTYKTAIGSADCTSCGINKYSTTVGAMHASTCQQCSANSASPAGSGAITDCTCNTGYTGADGGSCSVCPAGTYKIGTGSAACTSCSVNTYSTAVGATLAKTCKECLANSDSAVKSDSDKDCVCGPGWHGSNGAACSACSVGSWCF
ncbi:hypothetical protein T484DRAFT_1647470, partial [Baffinella frigidus]